MKTHANIIVTILWEAFLYPSFPACYGSGPQSALWLSHKLRRPSVLTTGHCPRGRFLFVHSWISRLSCTIGSCIYWSTPPLFGASPMSIQSISVGLLLSRQVSNRSSWEVISRLPLSHNWLPLRLDCCWWTHPFIHVAASPPCSIPQSCSWPGSYLWTAVITISSIRTVFGAHSSDSRYLSNGWLSQHAPLPPKLTWTIPQAKQASQWWIQSYPASLSVSLKLNWR